MDMNCKLRLRHSTFCKTPRFAMPIGTTHSSCVAREKREAGETLEAKLMEGLNTIESELPPEDWRDIRAEALEVVAARKKVS